MHHRLRPDIKTPTELALAVDHKKLKASAEALLQVIKDSGFVPPECYNEVHELQTKLVTAMADALCLVMPADIFIVALQQIATQEHPKRDGGPAAWKIAKETLEKFSVPYARGNVLAAADAFDAAIERSQEGDPYIAAAAAFFGIDASEVTKDHRDKMKMLLFGHIYGKRSV